MKTSPNAMSTFASPVELERARRAKIVATLGPSCSTIEVFRKLVLLFCLFLGPTLMLQLGPQLLYFQPIPI